MSFELEKVNIFCTDIKVYKDFLSSVFEVEFELNTSFYLSSTHFSIIKILGYKAPIYPCFELISTVSFDDLCSRIELYNFKNPHHCAFQELIDNFFQITDPFGQLWKLSKKTSL